MSKEKHLTITEMSEVATEMTTILSDKTHNQAERLCIVAMIESAIHVESVRSCIGLITKKGDETNGN